MAESQEIRMVTCTAPINIAVIKYWGKRDERLILPVNSSLSATLNQDELKATTSIALSKSFPRDRIWINGKEESIDNPRLQRCLKQVRQLCDEQHGGNERFAGGVHICSVNDFPTAAGLASSAAGYACLVYGLSNIFDIRGDVSWIARQGSGSACRSMYGGFVKWEAGILDDGSDSVAVQVAPQTHWPELEVLILVVSAEKKAVSSSAGMQTSVKTSDLLKHRMKVVPQRMAAMEQAIHERDFQTFAKLTMQDSNQFHAICLDTYPPIMYMNDTSRKIIQLMTHYNEQDGTIKAAYTFDAGPNAVIYAPSSEIPQLLAFILHLFPPSADSESSYVRGLSASKQTNSLFDQPLMEQLTFDPSPGDLKYIIHTKVGKGPQLLLGNSYHLLDATGMPCN